MSRELEPDYIQEFTRSWSLLKGKEDEKVQLWSYFDTIDWKHYYCIKIDGVPEIVIKDGEGLNPYSFYDKMIEMYS